MAPLNVYLVLMFCSSLFFSLIFNVNMVYQATVVQLPPLQLVLIGTILEFSVFLFEIPTGVLADVKSRRLSVIIGYALMGVGFLVEGSVPTFWAIALAQVLWGLGYTFTSGATQAWIADEVGEERAGAAFLHGAQASRLGGLIAIPFSIALGTLAITLPILLGGGLMIALAVFLTFTMTEHRFTPTPPAERTTWALMGKTVKDARHLVRRQRFILTILGIGLFHGLYSEGFDRLWTPHLLDNFTVPFLAEVKPVLWFGIINAISAGLGILTTGGVRRWVDTRHSPTLARILLLDTGVMVLALTGFGLARSFWLALALYWLFKVARGISGPLRDTWFNLQIDDPQVRATLFSVSSQVDAVGQIAGGPVIGAVGNTSIRAALLTSALILFPTLPLYQLALRHKPTPHPTRSKPAR